MQRNTIYILIGSNCAHLYSLLTLMEFNDFFHLVLFLFYYCRAIIASVLCIHSFPHPNSVPPLILLMRYTNFSQFHAVSGNHTHTHMLSTYWIQPLATIYLFEFKANGRKSATPLFRYV